MTCIVFEYGHSWVSISGAVRDPDFLLPDRWSPGHCRCCWGLCSEWPSNVVMGMSLAGRFCNRNSFCTCSVLCLHYQAISRRSQNVCMRSKATGSCTYLAARFLQRQQLLHLWCAFCLRCSAFCTPQAVGRFCNRNSLFARLEAQQLCVRVTNLCQSPVSLK